MENKTNLPIVSVTDHNQSLTIIELEERFEMTAAAVDTAKCDDNDVKVEVPIKAA